MGEVLKHLAVPFHVAAGSHLALLLDQFFQPLYDYGFKGQFEAFLSNGGIHYRCDYSRELSIEEVSAFDLKKHLGDQDYNALVDFLTKVQQLPQFRLPAAVDVIGETITDRGPMINFVPIGRIPEMTEAYKRNRDKFVDFDNATGYRRELLDYLTLELAPLIKEHNLKLSLGGQTSFDISARRHDKANAVWTLLESGIERIVFMGDALFPGGNDESIREIVDTWPPGTPCPLETMQVKSWEDTIEKLRQIGFLKE
jgi:hypothetical protein